MPSSASSERDRIRHALTAYESGRQGVAIRLASFDDDVEDVLHLCIPRVGAGASPYRLAPRSSRRPNVGGSVRYDGRRHRDASWRPPRLQARRRRTCFPVRCAGASPSAGASGPSPTGQSPPEATETRCHLLGSLPPPRRRPSPSPVTAPLSLRQRRRTPDLLPPQCWWRRGRCRTTGRCRRCRRCRS